MVMFNDPWYVMLISPISPDGSEHDHILAGSIILTTGITQDTLLLEAGV
jgi:hypothetical protein